ncbi:hypothetical protein AQUCO_00100241v1 [Aquilegia coerulea]|uniref:ceramide glucosyltransferase n=1 Tax=Aquilegia coerulea TaxID=218851 RepID=A0A2G5F9E3_AQUCA|nr:hypothetical protein AQUCO_00100241v1 [Aquilegia coerulea]
MAATFDTLDSFLISASKACLTSFAVFVQIQGCLICLTLALGWALAAYVRNREIRRIKTSMKGGNSLAFLYQDINELEHSSQAKLPRVSVVMPLKGFGEHNLRNWTSQDNIDTKIIVAGLSTTCSQKIHNQLVGVDKMHKESKYVLFLDDDVRLHPGTIGALTAEMEKNPDIFIQTGYPLDLPSGSLGSYCIYEYHMPCSMGFATGGRTFFLWGGCMMMHADDFRTDRYGVYTGLQDGGYSDDMTLAALAGDNKRLITSPPVAVFPHPLASDLSFSRYWNYLRKQTFVLESYISRVNWIMNRALFTVHFYLSWGFVAPYIIATIHVAAVLKVGFKEYPSGEAGITSGGLVLVGCLAFCTVVELISMWNLTRVEIQLCNILSPEEPHMSLDSYDWRLVFVSMLVDTSCTLSLQYARISLRVLTGLVCNTT